MPAPDAVSAVAVGRAEARKSLDRLEYHIGRGRRGARGVAREVRFLDALHAQTVRNSGRAVGAAYAATPVASFGQKARAAIASGNTSTIGRAKSSVLADYSADGLQPARDWTRAVDSIWVWTANASACPTCLARHGSKNRGPFTPQHPSCLCIPTPVAQAGNVRPLSRRELVSTGREYGNPRYFKKLGDYEGGLIDLDTLASVENVNGFARGKAAVQAHLNKSEVRQTALGAGPRGPRAPVDTDALHKLPDGTYTAERTALHDDIVREFLDDMDPGDTLTMTGGGPASGKSSMVKANPDRFPARGHVDADAIKLHLPEYNSMVEAGDMAAAAFVHEESSFLSKRILREAYAGRKKVLYDSVGDSGIAKLSTKLDEAHEAGQRVVAHYASNDLDLALNLAKKRAATTGRQVPYDYIRAAHRDVTDTWVDAVRLRKFDESFLWDTNIKDSPRLAAQLVEGRLDIVNEALFRDFVAKGSRSYDEVIDLMQAGGVYG